MLASSTETSSSQLVAVIRISSFGRDRLHDAGVLSCSTYPSSGLDSGRCGEGRSVLAFASAGICGLSSGSGDRHCDLGVSGFEAGGDQGLVGGGAEVGAELAEGGVAQHAPHAILDPAGQLGVVGRAWRRSSASAPARGRARPARGPRSGRSVSSAISAAARIGSEAPTGPWPSSTARSASRWSLRPSSAVSRAQPISKRPTAQERAPSGSGRASSAVGQLGEARRLLLAQPVAAGAGRGSAGGDPAPAGPPRSARRRRGRGRCRPP